MLSISRKAGEATILTLPSGDQIRIVADRNREGETLFHIHAPISIKIEREERPKPFRWPKHSMGAA